MCRLFAQFSTTPRTATDALVCGDRSLVAQSHANPDGWGLGLITPSGPVMHKAATPAWGDKSFSSVAKTARARALVAHIRKATVGAVRPENAHPFRMGRWMFAHNGSLFGFERLRPLLLQGCVRRLARQVQGSTDSELLFAYLLSAIRRSKTQRAPVKAGVALRAALGNLFRWARLLGEEPPKVNYILTDGRTLFAQRAGMELHLSASVGTIRVASEPTDTRQWLAIPEGSLLVGTPHQILRRFPPPDGFQVSWPAPLKPPPTRPNVVLLPG